MGVVIKDSGASAPSAVVGMVVPGAVKVARVALADLLGD